MAQNTPQPDLTPKPPPKAFLGSQSKLAQYLAKHIPGFSVSKFNNAVGNMHVLQMKTRTGTVGNMTQGQIGRTGPEAGTKLGDYSTIGPSSTAVTFTAIPGAPPGAPILLGPNFFSEGGADQRADELHEEIHAFTGKDDASVFKMLQLPPASNTGAISDAIKQEE